MKITEKKVNDEVKLFTLDNGKMRFSVMNYGCTITEIIVPSKDKKEIDVVLGCDDFEQWKECGDSRGSVVGRVANRIANAKFELNGKTFELDKNDGKNCLHSGKNRFEKMIWDCESFEKENEIGIKFHRISKSMEQGFAGNLDVTVFYSLNDKNELKLEYKATTDEATPINLTNHAYFNLNGTELQNGKLETVENHVLQLDCEKCLEIGSDTIPTGKIFSVKDTPFDFVKEKAVGKDIHEKSVGIGYDNCYVTNADETKVVRVGVITSPKTGISMEMFTNQRGVQVYSGNYLSGCSGKNGVTHNKFDGICFETQRFPDSVNQKDFPNCILNPNEEYNSVSIYKFC